MLQKPNTVPTFRHRLSKLASVSSLYPSSKASLSVLVEPVLSRTVPSSSELTTILILDLGPGPNSCPNTLRALCYNNSSQVLETSNSFRLYRHELPPVCGSWSWNLESSTNNKTQPAWVRPHISNFITATQSHAPRINILQESEIFSRDFQVLNHLQSIYT